MITQLAGKSSFYPAYFPNPPASPESLWATYLGSLSNELPIPTMVNEELIPDADYLMHPMANPNSNAGWAIQGRNYP